MGFPTTPDLHATTNPHVVAAVAKRALAWYISSDLVNYPLVYGSLSSVVALLLWIYVSSWLALFGAHLSAAVGRGARSHVL